MTGVQASSWAAGGSTRGAAAAGAAGHGAVPGDRSSAARAVAQVWNRNRELLDNAGALLATTGAASALGFAYWAVAARLFSQRAVGYGSAAVSAMTLLGTIGMLGLGTVLIGELPQRRIRAGLVSAALLASGLGSLVLGLAFVFAAPHISAQFVAMTGKPGQALLFAGGVALTAATLVFDQATVGLLRGGLQLGRNVAFAAGKLLALPVTAIIVHDGFGGGIIVSWVAGIAVSVLPVAARLWLRGEPVLPRPDWAVLRSLGRTVIAHNWLNLAIQVPRLLMPVLVLVIVSPSANAAFYAAWTLAGFLYIIPTHLATVLFALAAAEPRAASRRLRLTLRLSLMAGLPAMAVMGIGAHLALSLFGANYAKAATIPLVLLVAGYLPNIPKLHYIAVCRATGHVPRAAAVLSAAAVGEVAAATAGGAIGGLTGLSLALVGAYAIEGVATTPPVLRAAFSGGRHARPRHGPGAAASSAAQLLTRPAYSAAEPITRSAQDPLVQRSTR